ncbi:MAG: hypothetical protein IKR19_08060 [Acholeplasmatales bacterium]|nr:hypothetical protein [Acholeplasmatales bacterium]
MTELIMDAAVCAVDIFAGVGINFVTGKVAKKRVAKKVQASSYTTQEEFEKAFKKETLKANIATAAINTVTSLGLAAASAYVITDVIPGMASNETCDGEESTGDATETASELI